MTEVMQCMPVIGRVLVGFYFLFFGGWNIYHWSPTLEALHQKHIPLAKPMLAFGIVWQSVAGIFIIVDFYAQYAALCLIPFTLVAIGIFHPFWTLKGEQRFYNTLIFITNLTAVIGALLLI